MRKKLAATQHVVKSRVNRPHQNQRQFTAATYGWMRAHDTWQYKALYLDGNQRVRAFLEPGPFIPFAQKWAMLHDSLSDIEGT